jgi:poly-gamma-glutamate synthesis protein (capsule biosynthesis protein)
MIDNGADLIVGSHSHVPQGVEYYNGVPIFYSMGNYIFNSSNQNVIALKVTVDGKLNPTCQLLACYSEGGKTMEKTGTAATDLYEYIESISFGGVTVDEEGYVHPSEDTTATQDKSGDDAEEAAV